MDGGTHTPPGGVTSASTEGPKPQMESSFSTCVFYRFSVWLKCPDSPARHLGQGWAGLLPPIRRLSTPGRPWPPSGLGAGRRPLSGDSGSRLPQDSGGRAFTWGQPPSWATSNLRHARFASPGTCSSSGLRRRHPLSATVSMRPQAGPCPASHPSGSRMPPGQLRRVHALSAHVPRGSQ